MSTAAPSPRASSALRDVDVHPDLPIDRPTPVLELSQMLVLGLLVLLGLALNHSSVILGLNLSLADPLVAALVGVLLLSRRMWIPAAPLLFFLVLSVQLLTVTTLLVPGWTSAPSPLMDTGQEYLKLVVSFLCFLLGVQVVRLGLTAVLLRAFVVGAVAVSSIGVLSIVVPSLHDVGTLYLGGFRFQGLTNDPNNFAVMTIAALAALWYDPTIRPRLQVAASAILISGVLLSASKTGAITLLLLIIWKISGLRTSRANDAASRSRRLFAAVSVLALAVVVLMIAPATGIGGALGDVASQVPALERTSTLLTSFDTAVAGSGSERESAWSTALALIWFSPLLGIGVGSYLPVAVEVVGTPLLAHNTYLQVMAEWGVPLAALFFAWTARVTLWRPEGTAHIALWASSSTALLAMLTGSLGLSLNNSRVFWVLLGVTAGAHLLSRLHQEEKP